MSWPELEKQLAEIRAKLVKELYGEIETMDAKRSAEIRRAIDLAVTQAAMAVMTFCAKEMG